MDKQTDANVSLPRARRSFGTRTKARALKALQDYSKDSGRKWTLILGEILDLVGEPGARFGALTRQDLESWSRGDSELGDGKFSYIYDFLTHEETVGRPFFARLDLSERNELGLGRTLTEIFGPNEFRERGDAAAGRRGSDTRFAGVYSRADETVGPPVALKIWEVPGSPSVSFTLLRAPTSV